MCVDPSTAIAVGSAAVGAAGSLAQGGANAQAARNAAGIASANSLMALSEGSGQVAQIGQRVAQAQGRTRAAFGAGNIDVNSGSSLTDQVISAQQGNTDQKLVMARALNTASGQASQASADYAKVGQDQMAGIVGAGTAFLNAATSMYRGGGFGGMGGAGGGGFQNNPFVGMANGFGLSSYGFGP